MAAPRGLARTRQHGGFLLEALVGILIFTLGVLGLLALQARAVTYTSDATYRAEAAFLANDFVARMWGQSHANIVANFSAGNTEYNQLQAEVERLLPGATNFDPNPAVEIIQPAGGAGMADARGDGSGITLSPTGTLVTVTIQWQPPGPDGVPAPAHQYTLTTIIAQN